MTFDVVEKSQSDGRPIELYEIRYSGNYFRFTSSERIEVRDGLQFTPIPVTRSKIEASGDIAKANLTLTIPANNAIGELFRVQPPSEVVFLTIYAKHDLDGEFYVIWKGRILNGEWRWPWLDLTSDNVYTSLKRIGLRRRFSTQCTHPLYGVGCYVDSEQHKQVMTLDGLTGIQLQFNEAVGKAADFYAGGFATWINPAGANLERRMIRASDGTSGVLTLASLPIGLSVGMEVNVYPGCNHIYDGDCQNKFNNTENFGGVPFVPKKSPFGGSTLY